MGRFANVKGAKSSLGGVYPLPGTYEVEVKACKAGKRRVNNADYIVTELKILKSSNAERPVGSEMSWLVTFDKDAGPGNMVNFLAVIGGKPGKPLMDSEVDDEENFEWLVSPENPAEKTLLALTAAQITTRAGKPFTKCQWSLIKQGPKVASLFGEQAVA